MFKITNAVYCILVFSVALLISQSDAFGVENIQLDFPIGLKMGETASINSELKMTLLDIEDSRCPSDVQCIWEGTVTAKIKLEKETKDLGVHNISLTNIEENEKMFDGYYIRLTNVKPYPESIKPTEPTDYVLTFFVSKGEIVQVDSPLKQFKNGVAVNEIQCNNDLVLIIKKNDSTPSCVYYSTSEKLISRGWGELVKDKTINQVIKTGTNSGFCLGYCSKEFVITPEKITYIQSGHDVPDKTKHVPFSRSSWNELTGLVDVQKFNSLPDRIGCPGCADAPVEWIEITYGDKTKKIEFELGDEIPEIEKLVSALQIIRSPIESTIESFEDCVASGNPVMESYPRQCRTNDGKSFTETMDSHITLESQCKNHGGKWLSEWNECEYVLKQQCLVMKGDYFECESACRHDVNAEMCTTQCVPVCVIP